MVGHSSVCCIVPCYNGQEWIQRSVASILAQTHRRTRVVVVDDGSTDSSVEILHCNFQGRIDLITQPNGGVAAARNRGMRSATEDFIAFCDQDDLWHREKLTVQIAELEKNPDIVAVYCDAIEINEDGTRELYSTRHPLIKQPRCLVAALLEHDIPLMSATIIRRAFLERHRLDLIETAAGVDDLGLFLEMTGLDAQFSYVDHVGVTRYLHGTNQSRDHRRRFVRRLVMYEKVLARHRWVIRGFSKYILAGKADALVTVAEDDFGKGRYGQAREGYRAAIRHCSKPTRALACYLLCFAPTPILDALRFLRKRLPMITSLILPLWRP